MFFVNGMYGIVPNRRSLTVGNPDMPDVTAVRFGVRALTLNWILHPFAARWFAGNNLKPVAQHGVIAGGENRLPQRHIKEAL